MEEVEARRDDSLLDDGREAEERDRDESMLDDGREYPSFYRYEDEAILDDVWTGHGVESDEYARNAADMAYKRAISEKYHPLVADALSLEEYDDRGGESPWYIEKKQALIGADPTGIFDDQTQDRIDLIVAAAELVRESEREHPDRSPSSQPAALATTSSSQMFELSEPAEWDLTPSQKKTHAAARKLAIQEYQKARANGQSHPVGAAMWLGRYIKSGGSRKETVYMMQRECGMPYELHTGVWDQNTKKWITQQTADYRAWLSSKK